jgi:hypothetical protein
MSAPVPRAGLATLVIATPIGPLRLLATHQGLRAVHFLAARGAANGANPLPIIVPCHRIVGSNGALVGYGGGLAGSPAGPQSRWGALARKRWLLAHERAVLPGRRAHPAQLVLPAPEGAR